MRKLIVLVTLCITFFYGCSKEESFVEENEVIIVKKKKKIILDAASKLPGWIPGDDLPTLDDPDSTSGTTYIEILVEYYGDVTEEQKLEARSIYGSSISISSFEVLDNDSEIWIVNESLYNSTNALPACCPIIKSTEAEPDDIDRSIAINTVNPIYKP